MFVQGAEFQGDGSDVPAVWCGITAFTGGILLTIGFLTPLVAILLGLGVVSTGIFSLQLCSTSLFDSRLPAILASAMLIAIVLLGPGAISIDARMFGRREIIIPRYHSGDREG